MVESDSFEAALARRRRRRRALNLTLTFCTCGLWGLVWLGGALQRRPFRKALTRADIPSLLGAPPVAGTFVSRKGTTRRTAVVAAAMLVAITSAAHPATGTGSTVPSSASLRPRMHGVMHWVHRQPGARSLEGPIGRFRSTIVVGLESMRSLDGVRADYGLRSPRAIPELHAATFPVEPIRLRRLLTASRDDPRIRYIAPVGPTREVLALPSDPLLTELDGATGLPFEWQFEAAGMTRALELAAGSPSILVGMIDTGAADVPDLAGKIDGRWRISLDGTLTPVPDEPEGDAAWHGTAVASLIVGNVDDGFGMAGFGGEAHLISVRDDELGFSDTSVAIALTKLVSLGVRIVNLSLGGTQPCSPILLDALHKAARDGVLVIASAGNSHGRVTHPAADLQPSGGAPSYGLAVGASTLAGRPASFSNTGAHLSLLAPGDYAGKCSGVLVAVIPATRLLQSCWRSWPGRDGGYYAYLGGTSFAAAEVAGVAALVWAARPQLTNYEVAEIIKQAARPSGGRRWSPTTGCGLLDAGEAMRIAVGAVAKAPAPRC